MNKFYLIILCLILAVGKIFAQSDIYKIENISKPEKLLATVSRDKLYENVEKNFVKLSVSDNLIPFETHPVIGGYLLAYQKHYPLTISPDIAWLLICQGFANHINTNPEKYRSKFVGFEGKKTLTVERTISSLNSMKDFQWDSVFPDFTKQIASYTGKELIDNLTADFTTTTPKSLIASKITIMESTKEFFDYKLEVTGCGISEVTVEGSVKDWEKILKRLDYVGTFGLEWWTSKLNPVIQKIIDTKNGKVDKQFWMNMVKYHTLTKYGLINGIDGWLLKFYPYLISEKPTIVKKSKNKGGIDDVSVASFPLKGANKNRPIYLEPSRFRVLKDLNYLPKELANVPFIVELSDGRGGITKTYNMEFWAGFMGASQDTKTFNLKPEIGWAVNLLGEAPKE